MHRYSTPYHVFTLPVPVSLLVPEDTYITYSQYDDVILEKTLEDCRVLNEYTIALKFSQEDSAKFSTCEHNHKVELQITLMTKGGNRIPTDVIRFTVDRSLKEGVI